MSRPVRRVIIWWMDDETRQVTTRPDTDYSLSIDEAAERYEHAGHPRTPRSIQRYCAKGHLDCRRIETSFGEKYLIISASVAKHIAYIEEVRPIATGRDTPRPVVGDVTAKNGDGPAPEGSSTSPDQSRQVATDVKQLERIESENQFLRGQVVVKDEQIKDLTERARETNHLIAGLQTMMTPLLGRPTERDTAEDLGRPQQGGG